MFGRITKFQSDPARLEEMTARIPDIRNATSAINGSVANWAMWNDDGSGVAIAVYDSEAAADAATPQIQAIWGGLSEYLTAPPEVMNYAHAEKTRN